MFFLSKISHRPICTLLSPCIVLFLLFQMDVILIVLCFQMDMITQGDSVYDIIDTRDHDKVRSNLLNSNPGYRSSDIVDEGGATDSLISRGTTRDDRVFFCRMSIARSCRRQTGPTEHKVCMKIYHRMHCIKSSVFLREILGYSLDSRRSMRRSWTTQ